MEILRPILADPYGVGVSDAESSRAWSARRLPLIDIEEGDRLSTVYRLQNVPLRASGIASIVRLSARLRNNRLRFTLESERLEKTLSQRQESHLATHSRSEVEGLLLLDLETLRRGADFEIDFRDRLVQELLEASVLRESEKMRRDSG